MDPLEQYFSRVEQSLRGIPKEARQLEIREIRSHLEESIARSVSHGVSREEAVVASTRRFGNAHAVGQTLARSWYRNAGVRPGSIPAAVASILVWMLAGVLVPILVMLALVSSAHPEIATQPLTLTLLIGWTMLVPPAGAGAISALLNPGCPPAVTTAVLAAGALLIGPFIPGLLLQMLTAAAWVTIGTACSIGASHWLRTRAAAVTVPGE